MSRRYLIGVGNATMTDDGVGPRIAEALAAPAAARGFEAVVSGHDTVGLLSYFDTATERLLFVDCVRMGTRPGDWRLFSPEDVRTRKRLEGLTTHEGDLLRIVDLARSLACPVPPITILGIEPQRIEPGLALSQALEARFEEYLRVAVEAMEGVLPPDS